ncbi:MAG: hypothetical protein WB630_22075, partial [Candidatus Acidiferrales bacterium]
EKQRQQQEAERLARRSRVAEAGGQLVAAAFAFLGEMIPQRQPTKGAEQKANEFKARLDECLERDEQGRTRLTVTLPSEAALESLARSLAALDMESNVREVALASGIEELKQRLEVLLGARAHAAVDETEKQRQQQEADRLARRSRVAEAGGQLVAAAFAFLGEMIPQRQPTNGAEQKASEIKARLDECLERDEQGRPRLTVTLPNKAALESLARSLAALFTVTET